MGCDCYMDVIILHHFCFPLLPSPTRELLEPMTYSLALLQMVPSVQICGVEWRVAWIMWQRPREPPLATCLMEELVH